MGDQNSSPIDRVQAHFKQKLGSGLKKLKPKDGEQFSVPEWELDVYYGPETIDARDRYLPLIIERKVEGYVEVLLARAKNAEGRPLFKNADKLFLMREADPDVVLNVGVRIFNDTEVSVDDARKS